MKVRGCNNLYDLNQVKKCKSVAGKPTEEIELTVYMDEEEEGATSEKEEEEEGDDASPGGFGRTTKVKVRGQNAFRALGTCIIAFTYSS